MGIRVVGGIIGNRRDEVRVGGIVDLIHIRNYFISKGAGGLGDVPGW